MNERGHLIEPCRPSTLFTQTPLGSAEHLPSGGCSGTADPDLEEGDSDVHPM